MLTQVQVHTDIDRDTCTYISYIYNPPNKHLLAHGLRHMGSHISILVHKLRHTLRSHTCLRDAHTHICRHRPPPASRQRSAIPHLMLAVVEVRGWHLPGTKG